MRWHTRKGFALTVLSVFVIGAASPSLAQQPIRIGATMALTGKYALQGGYGRDGYQLCQKHLNAQGSVLGRPVEFVIRDDASDEKTAMGVYEKLITEDGVDAVLGPYSSPITDAVADVTEKHRKVMIGPMAGTTSLWEKGRKYLVMVISSVELTPEGFVDLAARQGLKTIAMLTEDGLVAKAAAKGAAELARKKNLDVVFSETYPKATRDFAPILMRVKAARPDAFVIATQIFDELITITRQTKDVDLNVKMFASLPYGSLPDYQKRLEKAAEFVYSATFWEPSLPYPGNRQFVAAYEKEFNRPPALQAANAYAGCQLFVEAARRAGSVDSDKLREALLKLKTKTILGDFAIDERGFQIAQKAVTTQWQDGKQVIVWPDEVAAGKPRFPTPPWSAR
ncbi:MAG TPA: amino acid ABC transporter substrate-binding protein [Vicinamibacterales bacterium]|nr:amino acid ABC transporter substrate-binding protein [Vicinamibacterales bacterium]